MADESGTPSGEELHLEPVSVGTRTRRRALWAVLAVVAVAAGTLAVTSGDDGPPPQLPVALGAAAREAAGAPAADMSLAAWVTYVAGEGLPARGGDAPAYRLRGTADEARVRSLATALGLAGDPVHQDRSWRVESGGALLEVYEDAGGTWWFSTGAGVVREAGSAPASGGASAGCDPASGECDAEVRPDVAVTQVPACEPGADCSVTTVLVDECPPDADCVVPPPVPPTPPTDLPSEDEARRIALDLLGATGMDLADAKVTVDGPYDAWYVSVEPRLDGVPVSGWIASATVGSKGVVTSASGTLATAERLGDYPLVDTRAAIDRLNEQGAMYGAPVPALADDAAITTDVATAGAPAPTTPPCAADGAGCAAVDPVPESTVVEECTVQPDGSEVCKVSGSTGTCPDVAPVEGDGATETTFVVPECVPPVPLPEPEPVEVVLTEAEPVLVLLGAFDGSGDAYLVPGYRFSNADGVVVDAVAVADESLAPTTTTTVPETTVPESTDTTEVTEPPVTTCEVLVEDDGSGTTHTIQTCPPSTGTGDPSRLEPGQTPQVGVGYYVDVDVACGAFLLGDQVWRHDVGDLAGWSTPHEGGTFTLDSPEHGTFVGDAAAEKTATFVLDTTGEGCQPAPRT